jgi:hypothetical protein
MVLLSFRIDQFIHIQVLYKGIEPLFSARKAGVLTVRRIEQKPTDQESNPDNKSTFPACCHYIISGIVEVAGFEPTQR